MHGNKAFIAINLGGLEKIGKRFGILARCPRSTEFRVAVRISAESCVIGCSAVLRKASSVRSRCDKNLARSPALFLIGFVGRLCLLVEIGVRVADETSKIAAAFPGRPRHSAAVEMVSLIRMVSPIRSSGVGRGRMFSFTANPTRPTRRQGPSRRRSSDGNP